MASTEDPKGVPTPQSDGSPSEPIVSYSQTTDDPYGYNDDAYSYAGAQTGALTITDPAPPPPPPVKSGGGGGSPPPPPRPPDNGGDEEDGMLRMSFLEHLEELRSRLIRMLMGIGIAFVASLTFSDRLWLFVQGPAEYALKRLKIDPPTLVQLAPMDVFNIVWVKLPILTSIFISSPWILYPIWGFISPGLYKKERRWAAPFIICTAGLFILGGCFAYFVAFRYGLEFLLGIGQGINIRPVISIEYYFDLFVDVILGVALVFEMPIIIFFLTLLRIVTPKKMMISSVRKKMMIGIIFFLTLLRIVTPKFLVSQSRY